MSNTHRHDPKRWDGRLGWVRNDRIDPSADKRERFVGAPGMSAIGKHLAADLRLQTDVQVAAPQRFYGQWRLQSETGEALGELDWLILAVPAPQARALLASSAELSPTRFSRPVFPNENCRRQRAC